MSPTADPLDHIRAYAPPANTEPPSDELLDRVFADSESRPASPTRHSRLVIAATVACVVFAGFGAAAAAGVSPARIWNVVFGPGVPSGIKYQADPATARKVFVTAGPNGQEFAAWTISNRAGSRCLATFFEPAGVTAAPSALVHSGADRSCALTHPPAPGLFADGAGGYTPGMADRLKFVWEAGHAVRAELQLSTGATLPVAVHNGWLGGWYTRDQVPLGAKATIVAYGADGARLGSFPAIDQVGCDQPGGC